MIIGILGMSGTGKDAVTNVLVRHGAQKIAFADALKRMIRDLFNFQYQQLWGTQEDKETPDRRYLRAQGHNFRNREDGYDKCKCCGVTVADWLEHDIKCYLTPRYALQTMGTEGGRHCYQDIWIERAIAMARKIEVGYVYSQYCGVMPDESTTMRTAVFTDVRFISEMEAVKKAGGLVFRVRRPGFEKPAFDHPSETEQLKITDDRLDGVIDNSGTLDDLDRTVTELLRNHGL